MASYRTRTLADGSKRHDFELEVRGRREFRTFTRLTDGRRWAAKRSLELERDAAGLGSSITVDEAIRAYVREELPTLAASNRPRRLQHLQWWLDRIGHLTLTELTPGEIALWRASLTCGPATANRYQSALSAVLKAAVQDWHWIDANPALQVRRRREPRGRIRYLSPEERDALLAAVRQSYEPRLEPLVILALTTGARQGELLALRWADIDIERGVAMITTSKNETARALALGEPALRLLRDRGDEIDRPRPTDLLFPGSFPRHAWIRAVTAAGLDGFHFHDLRHTFASFLAMSGASLPELAAALGHKTLAMVARYSHLSPQAVAEAVRKVDFFGVPGRSGDSDGIDRDDAAEPPCQS